VTASWNLAVPVFSFDGRGFAAVFLGNGDGTFQNEVDYPAQLGAQAITAADVNGDGKLDLVVANEALANSGVSVLLGNGDGTFQAAVNYATGTMPYGVVVGDLNGDGIPDIATSDNDAGTVSLLLGNGDGTFQPHVDYPVNYPNNVATALLSLALGDFNGDGMLDLVVANADNLVTILLQSTLSVSATSLKFANQTVGTGSSPQASTLSNVATKGSVTISGAQVSGANASDFTVSTSCSKLQPKSACKVNVTFTPTATGTRTATVSVTDSAVGSPHQITVTGTGAVPAVKLSSTALTFGTQLVNTASPLHYVTLSNAGNGTLTISSIAASGDFSATNTCNQQLKAGASCRISIAFRPITAGARTGTVTITDSATGSPHSVSLSGNGTFFKLSSGALNFGNQSVGTTSPAQSVTLTNVAPKTTESVSVKMGGTDHGDFKQSNNCGAALAAQASCAITVTFAPAAAGSRTAAVQIIGGGGNPRTVTLTGNGN
jgi:hypothetical protein